MDAHGLRETGRRAISPIVATVLIVAVTLVASVAIAGFVFGVFGTSTNSAQVAVTAASLRSSDFLSTNAGVVFRCGAPAGSFLTLSNTGTASSAATAATINWAGQTNGYSLVTGSTCQVGASGSGTSPQNLLFASTTRLLTSATAGGTFTGSVTLASGAVLIFTGTFQ